MALCNRAGMPIMRFDGLGCRADAAEITPMEPVWVVPVSAFYIVFQCVTALSCQNGVLV